MCTRYNKFLPFRIYTVVPDVSQQFGFVFFFFFKDLLSQRKKKKKKTTKEKKKMLFFFSFLVSDRATMKTTNWPPRSVCPLKTRQIKYRFFFFLSLPCQNVRLRTHKEFAVSSGFDKTNSRELLRFASHTREKKNN